MTDWQDISTAPKDGTWFLICRAEDGYESFEVGRFDPMAFPEYEPDEATGLYRRVDKKVFDWRGFNNFHRATHWMPLPAPPAQGGA